MLARRRSPLLVLATLAVTGCGAIFNGTRQNVSVSSAPDQAQVTVDATQNKYTTPALISLERKNDYNLTFTKEGYSNGTFHIAHAMNGGILVLDILSGLVGIVIDAATGAWYSLSPSTVQLTLVKTNVAVVGPDSIHVAINGRGRTVHIESSVPGVAIQVAPR